MKTCVSSYSYSKLLHSGEYNQLTIMSLVKEMGFDGIEFTDLSCPEGISELDFARQLKAESERLGLPIVSYTVGADLLNAEDLDAEIARLCAKIDVAEALGAKVLRHDATGGYRTDEKKYKGFDQALPTLIKGYKAVTEYAEKKGIATMVENHGYFSQESLRVEKLITGVGSPNFGALVDVGNFACADDPSPVAVGRLAPFAKHVHVKDFHIKSGCGVDPGRGFFRTRGGNYLRGAIIGHGDIPVKQCLWALKNAGYDGYISIEFEGMEEPKEAIAIGLENLKKMIESI